MEGDGCPNFVCECGRAYKLITMIHAAAPEEEGDDIFKEHKEPLEVLEGAAILTEAASSTEDGGNEEHERMSKETMSEGEQAALFKPPEPKSRPPGHLQDQGRSQGRTRLRSPSMERSSQYPWKKQPKVFTSGMRPDWLPKP